MPSLSPVGLILAALYLIIGVYVVQDELRHSGGGWINLRGMATTLVTSPSQLTFGFLLRQLGVRAVRYDRPTAADFGELALHLLVTTGAIYLIGWGFEALFRHAFGG